MEKQKGKKQIRKVQRWKSQRIKIRRLGYGTDFLQIFKSGLGYDFFGNLKNLTEFSRLLVLGDSQLSKSRDFRPNYLCDFHLKGKKIKK